MIPKLPAGSRTQARDGDDPAMHAAMPRTVGDAASGGSPAGGRVYLTSTNHAPFAEEQRNVMNNDLRAANSMAIYP